MNLTKHWAATLDDYVIDLAWSPDGTQLAAASAAGPISLFAVADGARRFELPGHENGTNCLAWEPRHGRDRTVFAAGAIETESRAKDLPPSLLATGGQDGAVKFWDTTAGQHTATATIGKAWVEHLAWRPAGRTHEAERRELRVKSSAPNPSEFSSPLSALSSQLPASASCLAVSAGRDLVFLNADGSTRHRCKPAPKTITALAWEAAGGCVAVAYFGGVCLWDADDFIAQKAFPYANGIHALVWSPDSKWLVSGNQDPSVHLWIPEQDVELHMSGYETKVKHLSFDQSSRWLATGGGREACIWDCAGEGPEGREPAMLAHETSVCAVAFQHGHGLLATASADGVVRIWSPERKQPLRATVKMPVAATRLSWSPDDRSLAIGSEKGAVYVLKTD